MQKKPNHICKYSQCTLGEDGKQKHYYACNYCDGSNNWRASACCVEHYIAYTQEVLEARANNQSVNLLPVRTDKTSEEVEQIMNTPLEELKTSTIEELSQINPDVAEVGIQAVVEEINNEIDKKSKRRKGGVA